MSAAPLARPGSGKAPAAGKQHMAQGKRLLMQAAVRLAARQSSAQGVSLRELAREAGLNHNTFYRHFHSLEDLLGHIVHEFGNQLRAGLAQARREAPTNEELSAHVVGWVLDFALAHRDVFTVAMRERYGPPGPLRTAVLAMLQQLQDDMLADLQARHALPPLPEALLSPMLGLIVDQTFKACFEHIETPEHRAQRLLNAKVLFDTLMLGTAARLALAGNMPGPQAS